MSGPEPARTVAGMSSRSYRESDLPQVRRALAEWRDNAGLAGCCHAGEIAGRISEQHPTSELVRVWEDSDERLIGVEINHRFGCSFDVFTDPALRGSAAESAMLESACAVTSQRMRECRSEEPAIVSDVIDGDVSRVELLRELGFEHYRVWDHIVERTLDEPILEPELPTGFSLRRAEELDVDELVRVRAGAFGSTVTTSDFHVRNRIDDPQRQEFVVLSRTGRAACFAVLWFDELSRVGLFEPVGTHADFRRLGLARSVMLAGLREMSRRGMRDAAVQFDTTNQAADSLYASLGFTKKYTTHGYRRSRELVL